MGRNTTLDERRRANATAGVAVAGTLSSDVHYTPMPNADTKHRISTNIWGKTDQGDKDPIRTTEVTEGVDDCLSLYCVHNTHVLSYIQ